MNPASPQNDLTAMLARPDAIEIYPLSGQPIALPRRAGWKHLAVSYHRLPPGECRHSLPLHLIRIALQASLPLERISNGERMRHYLVTTGDLAFCQAYSQQWMRWLEAAEFLLLWLDPTLLTQLAEETQLATDRIELFEFDHEIQDPFIFQIGQLLQRELAEETTALSSLYVDALSNALAAHLLKDYCRSMGSKQLVFPEPQKLTRRPWKQVVEYIHEHLDYALSITELAAVAGLSPYHFTRSFKQTAGLSPHQYVLRVRIERAKTLLLQGEETLSALATRLGFADQSHFTRNFKRFVGVTPQDFVRQNSARIFHP